MIKSDYLLKIFINETDIFTKSMCEKCLVFFKNMLAFMACMRSQR